MATDVLVELGVQGSRRNLPVHAKILQPKGQTIRHSSKGMHSSRRKMRLLTPAGQIQDENDGKLTFLRNYEDYWPVTELAKQRLYYRRKKAKRDSEGQGGENQN